MLQLSECRSWLRHHCSTDGWLFHVLPYTPLSRRAESSMNIDHSKRIVFVHNPKAAGTSVRQYLGLPTAGADHRIPSRLCHKSTWESYRTIVFVRNPFDRLVSSYAYHTSQAYAGYYRRKYANLPQLSLEAYFDLMILEPCCILPQVKYTRHVHSTKSPDLILRFEDMGHSVDLLRGITGNERQFPHMNRSSHAPYSSYYQSRAFARRVSDYYHDDLVQFGYSFDR
jgi:hypothetical protein